MKDDRFGALARLSLCFAGGAIGALVNSLFVWALGAYGATDALGVQIAPPLTWEWVRPRVLWGGIWGLVFFACWDLVLQRAWLLGIIMGLAPSFAQLFYVFPVLQGQGEMGLELGRWTPALVVAANTVWGVAAAYWIKLAREESLFTPPAQGAG